MTLRRWAFTLSEIAVVTALVTSIPTASYVRVKQKAYQTQCVQNLRSIGQALEMFRMEDGAYPKATFFPRNPASDPNSIRVILGGQGAADPRLWICPGLPPRLQEQGLTFLYNDAIAGKTSIPDPTNTWVLIEFNCLSKKSPLPHPDGYNVLYGDGSVRTIKTLPKELADAQQAK